MTKQIKKHILSLLNNELSVLKSRELYFMINIEEKDKYYDYFKKQIKITQGKIKLTEKSIKLLNENNN